MGKMPIGQGKAVPEAPPAAPASPPPTPSPNPPPQRLIVLSITPSKVDVLRNDCASLHELSGVLSYLLNAMGGHK